MRRNTPQGFTLVELLTVIAIIVILVGILVPTIAGVMKQQNMVKSTALIQDLDSACELYKKDSVNGNCYPDQDAMPPQPSDALTIGKSESANLFTKLSGKYVQSKQLHRINSADTKSPIADGFNDGTPILYFPSKIGASGTMSSPKGTIGEVTACFPVNGYTVDTQRFVDFLTDNRFGANKVRNYDRFLLISPGVTVDPANNNIKRGWFLPDNIKNW